MFNRLSDAELRDHCRARLESLELWLRRLIDDVMVAAYGANYFDHADTSGNRLFKKRTVDNLDARVAAEPTRYPRRVDAILLEGAASIVCHPNLFLQHFQQALSNSFPGGADVIREMMERVTDVRNRLAHANPISVHDAARVVCYSSDIVESLREYFRSLGMNNDYNVPTIIRLTDSFGNRFHRNQLPMVHDGGIQCNLTNNATFWLRPGDVYTVEIEVDPAFDPSDYTITWGSTRLRASVVDQLKLVLPIDNSWVGASVNIQCRITSNKDWHRMEMGADDFLIVYLKVLPPLG